MYMMRFAFGGEFSAAILGAIIGGVFMLLAGLVPVWNANARKLRGVRTMLALEMARNLIPLLAQHSYIAGFREILLGKVPGFLKGDDDEIPAPIVDAYRRLRAVRLDDAARTAIGLDVVVLPRAEFDAVESHYSAVRSLPAFLPGEAPFRSGELYSVFRETKRALRTVDQCCAMLRSVGRDDQATVLREHFDLVLGDNAPRISQG